MGGAVDIFQSNMAKWRNDLWSMFNSLGQYPAQFSLSWIQQYLQLQQCQLTLELQPEQSSLNSNI